MSTLRALASSLGVNVSFLGGIPRSRIPALMASLDVLVVPSRTTPDLAEQFGKVIIEAMFAGTPVVASRSGSIPEVVDSYAVLVPEDDEIALFEALLAMGNAAARRDLAESGKRFALENYHPRLLAQKTVDFFGRTQRWFRDNA